MKETSELLFYLTAYPWFFMCFLLTVSLWFLRTVVGCELQFRAERYIALLILRDLDEHVRSGERWHESTVPQVLPFEVLRTFYVCMYDEAPKVSLKESLGVSLVSLRGALGFIHSTKRTRSSKVNPKGTDGLFDPRLTPWEDLSDLWAAQDRGLSIPPRTSFDSDEFRHYDASKE